DKLMQLGAETLLKTIKGLREGTLTPIPQKDMTNSALNHAPKIFKEDCQIDWHKNSKQVYNHIRGLSPYPAAFTPRDDIILTIYDAQEQMPADQNPPGSYESDGKTFVRSSSADGYIVVLSSKFAERKRMVMEVFLRGYREAEQQIKTQKSIAYD